MRGSRVQASPMGSSSSWRRKSKPLKTAQDLGVEGIAQFNVIMPSEQTAQRMKDIIVAAGKWAEYA